jgi:hypothetical protein
MLPLTAQQLGAPGIVALGSALRQLAVSAKRGVASWATVDVDRWSGAHPAKAQNLGERETWNGRRE